MPRHWTYQDVGADDDLEQGDILLPADRDLQDLFGTVHPHFTNEKYRGFTVITQSCDLYLRNGRCAARHINLAVIRELSDILFPLLDTVCESAAPGVYYAEKKRRAKELLERVFNQNEAALGLFYLHPDPKAEIYEPAVVLLRVSVAFRVEAYDTIRQARCGRLASQFQDKLGWLTGNLFSRVATEDWNEQPSGKATLRKMIDAPLRDDNRPTSPKWVQRSSVNAAIEAGVALERLARKEIDGVLEEHRPPTPREQVLDQVAKVVKDVFPWTCSEDLRRVVNRLANDRLFAAAFKQPDDGS